ncbi:class III lanthipeptide [Tengunoibacter tsumagoiensis]
MNRVLALQKLSTEKKSEYIAESAVSVEVCFNESHLSLLLCQ